MRAAFAIPLGYVATTLVVPGLFAAATAFVSLPLPRGLLFAPMAIDYTILVAMAFVSGLAGFVPTRIGLWRLGQRSALAFAAAGSGTGVLACILLSLPGDLRVLGETPYLPVAAFVGAFAGLLQYTFERALTGVGQPPSGPMAQGRSG